MVICGAGFGVKVGVATGVLVAAGVGVFAGVLVGSGVSVMVGVAVQSGVAVNVGRGVRTGCSAFSATCTGTLVSEPVPEIFCFSGSMYPQATPLRAITATIISNFARELVFKIRYFLSSKLEIER